MRTFLKLNLLVLIYILSVSCSFSEVQDEGTLTIPADINTAEEVNYSSLIDSLKYIQLKIPENEFVGNIGKVFLKQGYIGLLDRQKRSVWIFTDEGDYINQIKVTIGKGPGEVLTLSDAVFGEAEKVHILGAYRINTFDFEENLLNETHLPFLTRNFDVVSDEAFVTFMNNEVISPGGEKERGLYNVYTIDEEGEVMGQFLPLAKEKLNLTQLLLSNFYRYNDTLHHYSFLDNQIYEISNAKTVKVKYKIDYKDHKIPSSVFEEKKQYDSELLFLKEEIFSKDYGHLNTVLETDKYVIIGITYNTNRGYIFYNKKDGSSFFTTTQFFHNDFLPEMDVYFHLSFKNSIYGIKSASEIINFVENGKSLPSNKLKELVSQIIESDNPLLIKAVLK